MSTRDILRILTITSALIISSCNKVEVPATPAQSQSGGSSQSVSLSQPAPPLPPAIPSASSQSGPALSSPIGPGDLSLGMSYDAALTSTLLAGTKEKLKPCLLGTDFAEKDRWDLYECRGTGAAHEVIRPIAELPQLEGVRIPAQADLLGSPRHLELMFDRGVLTSIKVNLGEFSRELYGDVMGALSKHYAMGRFADNDLKDFDDGTRECVAVFDDKHQVWLFLLRGFQGKCIARVGDASELRRADE